MDSEQPHEARPPAGVAECEVLAALLSAHGNTCKLIAELPPRCWKSRHRLITELIDLSCAMDDFAAPRQGTDPQVHPATGEVVGGGDPPAYGNDTIISYGF